MCNMFKTCWFGEVVLISKTAIAVRLMLCGKYVVPPVGNRSCKADVYFCLRSRLLSMFVLQRVVLRSGSFFIEFSRGNRRKGT